MTTLIRLLFLGAALPVMAAAQKPAPVPAAKSKPVVKVDVHPSVDALVDHARELAVEAKFHARELAQLDIERIKMDALVMSELNRDQFIMDAHAARLAAESMVASIDIDGIKSQAKLVANAVKDMKHDMKYDIRIDPKVDFNLDF